MPIYRPACNSSNQLESIPRELESIAIESKWILREFSNRFFGSFEGNIFESIPRELESIRIEWKWILRKFLVRFDSNRFESILSRIDSGHPKEFIRTHANCRRLSVAVRRSPTACPSIAHCEIHYSYSSKSIWMSNRHLKFQPRFPGFRQKPRT